MQQHLDNLTKPIGSLGALEDLALRLAVVQERVPPKIEKRAVYVMAGDHGIVEEGITLYPREVTAQMVVNFLRGGAAVNVLAAKCGFDVFVVDTGVSATLRDKRVLARKVGPGTRNFFREDAMSEEQLERCLDNGRELAAEAVEEGYSLVALGDMGIGNTTTAAALLAGFGFSIDDVVDRGTGIDEATLQHKKWVVSEAVRKHSPFRDMHHLLRSVGGFEFATMVGFIIGLKSKKIPCILDGFPVTAAAFVAWNMDRAVIDYLFAGHLSKVQGHEHVLGRMGLSPIVDFEMRLGEGTGAIIGGHLLSLAAAISAEMASFDSAGVSRSTDIEENY
jgi:nicotinate-nucleotide--dimethylbenzimidazole phosphoribosyltransferase